MHDFPLRVKLCRSGNENITIIASLYHKEEQKSTVKDLLLSLSMSRKCREELSYASQHFRGNRTKSQLKAARGLIVTSKLTKARQFMNFRVGDMRY